VAILDDIRIVLVQPASPGNVGATARVLKNTGLSRLVLVSPGVWDTPEARWRAHGASDILDAARTFATLSEATADAHLVIGTTHRLGRFREVEDDYVAVLRQAAALAGAHQVAVVFGREKDGLWHDEIALCHRLIRIPSAVDYPSFNLSHAVLLVAYELFRASGKVTPTAGPRLVTAAELESLCDHILAAMATIGFQPHNDDPASFRRVVHRVLTRTPLARRDANAVHRICIQIEKFSRRSGEGGPLAGERT